MDALTKTTRRRMMSLFTCLLGIYLMGHPRPALSRRSPRSVPALSLAGSRIDFITRGNLLNHTPFPPREPGGAAQTVSSYQATDPHPANIMEQIRRRAVPGEVDDHGPPDEIVIRDKSPEATVEAPVPVVTHDEIGILRNGQRRRYCPGGTRSPGSS